MDGPIPNDDVLTMYLLAATYEKKYDRNIRTDWQKLRTQLWTGKN